MSELPVPGSSPPRRGAPALVASPHVPLLARGGARARSRQRSLPVLLSGPGGDEERAATPAPIRWTTFVISGDLRISLPAGWNLAPRTLTPHLSDPKEQFSAATFPLVYRQGRCNHQPDGALERMTSTRRLRHAAGARRGQHARLIRRVPAASRCAPAAEDGNFVDCLRGRRDLTDVLAPVPRPEPPSLRAGRDRPRRNATRPDRDLRDPRPPALRAPLSAGPRPPSPHRPRAPTVADRFVPFVDAADGVTTE